MRLVACFAPLAAASPLIGSTLVAPGCGRCAAAPTCGDDEIEVDECNDDGTSCHEVEVCGNVVYCEEAANCLALPSCGPGFEGVETCPPGVTCQEETLCGTTILCAPQGPCTTSADCAAGRGLHSPGSPAPHSPSRKSQNPRGLRRPVRKRQRHAVALVKRDPRHVLALDAVVEPSQHVGREVERVHEEPAPRGRDGERARARRDVEHAASRGSRGPVERLGRKAFEHRDDLGGIRRGDEAHVVGSASGLGGPVMAARLHGSAPQRPAAMVGRKMT